MKTFLALLVALLLVGGALVLTRGGGGDEPATRDNVTTENGKQIVTIVARGGYTPARTIAKAGLSTIIHVISRGFDCSAAVRIPSLQLGANVTAGETADLDIGTSAPGTLRGTCAMGMYNFSIEFQK